MTAEFVGTCALVTLGPGAAAVTAGDGTLLRLVFVAAVFGSVVAMAIVTIGRVSGANINPAVTLALALRDRRWSFQTVYYMGTQLAAGLAAGLLLAALLRPDASSGFLGATALGADVSPMAGVALEAAGTFVLAFVALHASRIAPSWGGQAAVVGVTLFVLIMVIAPFTGASFNPARSFGPAVASGFLENLGLYFAGPLIGGAAAGTAAYGLDLKNREGGPEKA